MSEYRIIRVRKLTKEQKEERKKNGCKGGNKTLKRYGKEHFSNIVKERWRKYKEQQMQTIEMQTI